MNNIENKILSVLDKQIDGFITPNQSDFEKVNVDDLFNGIYSLINKGILRRRNCEGLAYERKC